jgi:uncharacterized membrane protein YebE (DUF533 family)
MFDAKALLNAVLGGEGAAAATQAVQSAGTAVSGAIGQAEAGLKDTSAGEMIDKAKAFASENPTATVAAVGGLAALLLGTETGRDVAGGVLKVGGLAALGGLAYKAFSNYQQGKPLMAGVPGLDQLAGPPAGSVFHADAHGSQSAELILRAMVATAAADGTVDPGQRAKILGEMQAAGVDASAVNFIDGQIQHPATVTEIASAVAGSQELAVQVYAAASLMAASPPERAFLTSLGNALGLSPDLISHVQAALPRTA